MGVATRTINVVDKSAPIVTFGTNGNSTYAKNHLTTITVSDHSELNSDSLKYLWNTSTSTPSEESFSTVFTNGDTVSTPLGVTGSYYLWVLAKDSANNVAITKSNVFNLDNTAPVITISGNNPYSLNEGSIYNDPGATAVDNIDGNLTNIISSTSTVVPSIVGAYEVTYEVIDSAGNNATATRVVNVIDTNAPTVSFGTNGNSTYAKTYSTTVTVTDTGVGVNTSSLKYQWKTTTTTPTEASFSTSFTNGGSISTPASTDGHYLWILAKDTIGNTEITRSNVFNIDVTAPVITINGSNPITFVAGTAAYADAGATATDNINGTITSSIVTTGANIDAMGTQTVTYTVSDSAGNQATATRTVNVTSLQFDYLVVGGGGGGGRSIWWVSGGGGGGAGAYRTGNTSQNSLSSNSIVVGDGGAGRTTDSAGGTGGSSTAFGITSAGGGGGAASGNGVAGASGASGGGGAGGATTGGAGGSYGKAGGNGLDAADYAVKNAGGGGGAGTAGANAGAYQAGAGGSGLQWLDGKYYAGGGGGGSYGGVGHAGAGGTGGGGAGGENDGTPSANGTNGTANTGGGGGGTAGTGSSGAGGSGVVIVRYYGAPKASGGTITTVGGYTYHTFTVVGTSTFKIN